MILGLKSCFKSLEFSLGVLFHFFAALVLLQSRKIFWDWFVGLQQKKWQDAQICHT